ncbi:beta-ketoacyl synthase [Aspergillus heterothallicus]
MDVHRSHLPWQITTKEGHFLKEDIAAFDSPFFSMTAAEAEGMDPQHRILLEVTYEAFENAGIPLRTVTGSQTAVMVGWFTKDYEVTLGRENAYMSPYASTGCGGAMITNRLSWLYDLRGPSLLIDIACSSSLVGLHLACQEIRSGGSKMVPAPLVAAVSGLLYFLFIVSSRWNIDTPMIYGFLVLLKPGLITFIKSAVKNTLYLWLVAGVVSMLANYVMAWGVFSTI